MEEQKLRIVLLCGDNFSSRVMFHALHSHFTIIKVIIENKPSSLSIIRRRLRKLGVAAVTGQILFKIFNVFLGYFSSRRIHELIRFYAIHDLPIPSVMITRVASVNDPTVMKILQSINPDAIVVNGTRIIAPAILSSVSAPFLNTHMGITPKYRGVHGGYWALAMQDPENCGVTVHLVDAGIDTGGILYQDRIHPEASDNFNTYPIHQIAKAIPLMRQALNDIKNHTLENKISKPPSFLWHHPTLWTYLVNRWYRNVK
ncbi:MAG: formyl transferase [Magnetococcus sp. YQC-9]